MPDHIKASIERLFHKTPAMKFPPISMSGFQSIYHFTVNAHCTHFLPGAPLGFGKWDGFAEIVLNISFFDVT